MSSIRWTNDGDGCLSMCSRPPKQLVFAEPANGTAVSINPSSMKENRSDVAARS
jgi:hypothetical protein